jgi:hypothetical protein
VENPTIHSCSVPRVLKKIACGAGLLIGVLLASLLAYYLFALATGTTFNETQWAAAGAWFGGLMTFGAVSVAVWQTNNANKRARDAEKKAATEATKAENRHNRELAAANQRTLDQIDLQRRRDQIACVVAAYRTYNALRVESNRIIDFTNILVKKTITPDEARETTRLFTVWESNFTEIHNAYAAANITVSNQPTREMLMECDQLAGSLAAEIKNIHSKTAKCYHPHVDNIGIATSLVNELGIKAEELLNAARDNLSAPASKGTSS